MRVAAREVREGNAQGMISAGNTGACMAIAKTVIEAHGGTIEAHSIVGQGTTITIDLPTDPS